MNLHTLQVSLWGISAYREILDTPVMRCASRLLDAVCNRDWKASVLEYAKLFHLLHAEGFSGLGEWLWDALCYTESPYALMCEQGKTDPALEYAARRDVGTFSVLAGLDCDRIVSTLQNTVPPQDFPVLSGLPRWHASSPFDFDTLTRFYQTHGAGLYARYRAFLWEDGSLIPVADPDCPRPEELLGYELQRRQVEANTRLLLSGKPANNVLLFGDGGTGKSATVKSMLYIPGFEDLRLIEIEKENLTGLPRLMRSLSGRRQKFILFIDDLAFDKDDKTYSALKTILEGSLEKRPPNTIICATSNRRHLVKQNFSDRSGDEVDAAETISEKTALAERFGLRIPYLTMNKTDYLKLVDYLAYRAGIQKDPEWLHAQAMTWEIRHAGRTPRVAQQFIASLQG